MFKVEPFGHVDAALGQENLDCAMNPLAGGAVLASPFGSVTLWLEHEESVLGGLMSTGVLWCDLELTSLHGSVMFSLKHTA